MSSPVYDSLNMSTFVNHWNTVGEIEILGPSGFVTVVTVPPLWFTMT